MFQRHILFLLVPLHSLSQSQCGRNLRYQLTIPGGFLNVYITIRSPTSWFMPTTVDFQVRTLGNGLHPTPWRTCHSLQYYPVPSEKTIVLMVKRATCNLAGQTDRGTAASNWHIVPVHEALEESRRQGKIEILCEKLVPVPFCQRRPPRSEIQ